LRKKEKKYMVKQLKGFGGKGFGDDGNKRRILN
jgi:hypothetical protein